MIISMVEFKDPEINIVLPTTWEAVMLEMSVCVLIVLLSFQLSHWRMQGIYPTVVVILAANSMSQSNIIYGTTEVPAGNGMHASSGAKSQQYDNHDRSMAISTLHFAPAGNVSVASEEDLRIGMSPMKPKESESLWVV
jgi:hypothetical protein